MTLMHWGRGLLIYGLLAALVSAAPAILVGLLPPGAAGNFVELVAILLTLTVTPLAVLVASVGAILLLVALLRRVRS